MITATTGDPSRDARGPGLAATVAFLSRPGAYPEPTEGVLRVQTHMSWVFLLDASAYKLKKPVRLSYLDFSTPALRKFFCDEELRLNRRLSEGVYLDVVPLMLDASGFLRVGAAADAGDGDRVVDWLVHMRRLPAERMLDRMIVDNRLGEDDVRRVVERLARFYRAGPAVPLTPDDYRARFAAAIRQNRSELVQPRYGLDAGAVGETCRQQLATLERLAPLLAERATAGRLVEGHGDLRPEHVCLMDAHPQFIDCLEFSRDLRVLDPVDELAFLALECERLGAPWTRECIFRTYAEATGDAPPTALVAFYQSYRAAIRARIAAWHLDDESVQAPARWIARAGEYLRLARARIDACGPC